MASRPPINPSPWITSISDLLLFHFGQSISKEAMIALEERDAAWRTANDVLRSQCYSLNAQCCDLNRWLEVERNKQRSLEAEIARREENERCLQVRIREFEEREQSRNDDMVLLEKQLEKADKELKELEVERVRMVRIIDGLTKEKVEKANRIRQLQLKKNDEVDRVGKMALLEKQLEKADEERKELEEEIRRLDSEKNDKIDRVMFRKVKRKLEDEVKKLEKAKIDENRRILQLKRDLVAAKQITKELVRRIEGLEKGKGETEAVLNTEIERIVNEKRRLEDKITQLDSTIQVLKKEKWEKEAEIRKMKMEKSTTIQRIMSEKVALEAQNRRLEEEMERTSELVHKNDVLEKEKGEMEDEFEKRNDEKNTEIERIVKEKMALDMEKRRAEERSKEEQSELVHRIEVLERDKGALEAQVCEVEKEKIVMKERMDIAKETLEAYKRRLEVEISQEIMELVKRAEVLEKDKNEAFARIVEVKKALEAQKSRAERAENQVSANLKTIGTLERAKEALEAKISNVYKDVYKGMHRIGVLEREKKKLEAIVCPDNEKSEEIKRLLNENKALEAQKRDVDDKVSELVKRIELLRTENKEMGARVCQAEKEKSEEIHRILNEKIAMEAEKRAMKEDYENRRLEERTSEVVHKSAVMEKDKGAIEAGFRETNVEKSTDIEKMLSIALEDQIRVLDTEKGERSTETEKIMKDKTDLDIEKRRAEKCSKEENAKLVHRIQVLERCKGALEGQLSKTEKEKNWMQKRMDNVKKALEAEKRRLEEEKNEKMSELVKRAEILEKDKIDASARIFEVNRALEAQKSLAMKAENQVSENLKKIGVLEREKEALESKVSKVAREVTEGVERIRVLEKERKELEAKVCQANSEKSEEIKKLLNEGADKVSELVKRMGLLKKENKELEAKVCQANKEKSEEIKRILNEKMALEAQKRDVEDEGTKKVSELVKMIGLLEKENKDLEDKVCEVEKEKSEEIQRILNETIAMEAKKWAMKEDYEKRVEVLEKEKQGCETDIEEKVQAIKFFLRENSRLEGLIKKLEMKINGLASKSNEDAQLSNNVITLKTFMQNEGQNFASLANSSEHRGSINHDVENSDGKYEDEWTRTNACKRKRSIRKCGEPGKKILKPECEHLSTCFTSTGVDLVDVKPELVHHETNTDVNTTWCANGSNVGDGQAASEESEADQDLLDVFDVHPELCLQAVCALYRQHILKNTSLSSKAKGFKPEYSSKGIALAEYLIREDPGGRKTEKMVAKLNKFDKDAVGECINIAKQHYKQVVEIYKKKEDPVFL